MAEKNVPVRRESKPLTDDRLTLTLTRVFHAERRIVFQAWSSAEHMAKWWGPHGFTVPHFHAEFQQGGAYGLCMRSPEGRDYWVHGAYEEIREFDLIVFTWAHEDLNGAPRHKTQITVELEEAGAGTRLTLRQATFESESERDSHQDGWGQTLERLASYLAV